MFVLGLAILGVAVYQSAALLLLLLKLIIGDLFCKHKAPASEAETRRSEYIDKRIKETEPWANEQRKGHLRIIYGAEYDEIVRAAQKDALDNADAFRSSHLPAVIGLCALSQISTDAHHSDFTLYGYPISS